MHGVTNRTLAELDEALYYKTKAAGSITVDVTGFLQDLLLPAAL
jgi:hypothetical protein